MMVARQVLPDRKRTKVLAIGEQHRRPRTRLAGAVLDRERAIRVSNRLVGNRQTRPLAGPSCNDTAHR